MASPIVQLRAAAHLNLKDGTFKTISNKPFHISVMNIDWEIAPPEDEQGG